LYEPAAQIWRPLFWVEEAGEPRLLPLGLDPVLPPDAPLQESKEVRLYPAPPVQMTLEAIPPVTGGATWKIRARLQVSGGEPVRGREVRFESSSGDLGAAREVEAGVYEAELRPGRPGPWAVSAVETESRVGAVIRVDPDTGRSP
jgi:hypothetical protein